MLPRKLCFVDLETTGGSSTYDRVIEIGMLRVEDGVVTKEYQSLVNPEKYIPPEIERLTGITGREVADAPLFYEIKDHILETLEDCIFVAHNVRFDYGFLKSEFSRLQMSFSPKHICTVKLSRLLYPTERHHNLDAVINRCGIECVNRHRAFDDAKVLYEFFQHSLKQFPLTTVEQALNITMKKPSLPTKLNQVDLDRLPQSPGVYIFYGQVEEIKRENHLSNNPSPITNNFSPLVPLYIGKSINIRERVLSHFAADIRSGTEMKISQQIERIETIQTAGELGALFTESSLIKQLLPIYNKMLRRKQDLIAIKHKLDSNGYESTYLEQIATVDPDDFTQFVGFFRSRRQAKDYLAKVAKEHMLCEKLLGLESTTGSCFGYRLDRCKGACNAKELTIAYNMRFAAAFTKLKVKAWPFPGPVAIQEQNLQSGKNEFFLVDRWCYLGSITYDEFGVSRKMLTNTLEFDLDTYKILLRFMLSPQNSKKIKVLSSQEAEEMQHTMKQSHSVYH